MRKVSVFIILTALTIMTVQTADDYRFHFIMSLFAILCFWILFDQENRFIFSKKEI